MFLTLIITQQCNLFCAYCPVLKRQGFMALSTAFRAVDFYLAYLNNFQGEKKIKIFGGEPLSNIPLLRDIIAYIRQKDKAVEIDLTTNGIFLDKKLLLWLRKNKVNLTVSVDGDFKTQSKNRIGMAESEYKNILKLLKPFFSEINFNMVIAPNNVDSLVKNFLYLHRVGVRKFNLLPSAYVLWDDKKIEILEKELEILLFFVKANKDIYLKNCDRTGDLFFLTTGLVIDKDGGIFLTDAIMLKEFQKIKNSLKIGDISGINSFKKTGIRAKIDDIMRLINRATPSNILKSNEAIDSLMDNFIAKLKEKRKERRVVDIKIGYRCNNNCFFCAQGDKREKCAFREKEKIKKELAGAGKKYSAVVFTGGEPTLHPHFLDFVEFARKLNFRTIQIQTNGRMFGYKNFCLETIRRGGNGIIEFSPSLHGHKASLHDYLTSAQGSFNQTVQGIKNLKALRQRIITNSVITSTNYRYLPALAKLLVSLKVDQVQFAFLHIVGTAGKNKKWIAPRKSDIMPYVKKAIDIVKQAGITVMTEAIPYCLMEGYEDCIAEQIIPDAKVIEKNLVVESFSRYRRNIGKAKAKKCEKCVYFSVCEGPWREYPDLFGWSEFKPILR